MLSRGGGEGGCGRAYPINIILFISGSFVNMHFISILFLRSLIIILIINIAVIIEVASFTNTVIKRDSLTKKFII
jgi:hypothetical protein